MLLQEIFDQLTYGELSQLSIGGGEAGVIKLSNYKRIVPHINLALTALHKRFNIKESNVTFILQPNGYSYLLQVEDIIKIERVLTDDGFALGLNDGADKYSCFTPSIKVLNIAADIVDKASDLPEQLKTISVNVVYRANHAYLVVDDVDADTPVDLPYIYLEPLLLFVAARVMAPLGTGQFEGLAGNTYMAKYEAACQQITDKGLQIDTSSNTDRLYSKGWI